MPDSVPPAVAKSFAALIPAILTLSVFTSINAIVTVGFNTNLHDVIYNVIQVPLVGLGSSIWETFIVGLGGSGMTLAVVIIMAFIMKKKQYRDVGRLALCAGIFNVNEPVIFGLPIVLNATILIPWVISPIIITALNYFIMSIGLVPAPTGVSVPWTVPIFFSGMIATNSLTGGILQIIDCLLVGFIWYPFLRMLDKQSDSAL
ncbi:PTS transporter subunit EIIC [Streptococcus macedonicus]|uniref:PTS system cellobiose-specific transporter subunit IIC n=2 Tax=Streptococcus TaxID=1301 RepID=A0A380K2N8_9STRE|nr:PTS system cellobiose-specific transporter subunit IIC [Streptococcus gallolyticus]